VNASNEVAARADGRKDAIKLLQLNAEFNPKSPATYQAIAQNSLAIADTAAAVSALEKLLELDPENPLAKRVLGTIKKP
jgi:tetratricopeptide (TPR) repeat protein